MLVVRAVSLCFCVVLAAALQREGDVCLVPSKGAPTWVCKVLQSCGAAIKLLKKGEKPPVKRRCDFKDELPMVCCPPFEIANWSSTQPVPLPTRVGPGFVSNPQPTSTSTRRPTSRPTSKPTSRSTSRPTASNNGSRPPTSKAAKMCEEYKRLVYKKPLVMSLISDNNRATELENRCELAQELITGGKNAEPKEFPHMALLGYDYPNKWLCGGSLISDKYVLSAAHCAVHSKFGKVRRVLLGELDYDSETDVADPQRFKVARVIVHEGYADESTYNDIMIIELERRVQFSLYIRPLCLHTSRFIRTTNNSAIATGWGQLSAIKAPSSMLQKVSLPLVSHSKCFEAFKTSINGPQLAEGIKEDTQLCAGGQLFEDSCTGDSGGPLQIPLGNCMFSQIGVISFGRICGQKSPGVYTRVSAYIPWIEKHVWP